MSDIFISYASQTSAAAQRVAKALRAGAFDVWRDDDLPPHRPFAEVIEEHLRSAKAVVVIWSPQAIQSQWVRAEADFARAAGKLVQVAVDGALPPMPFNQIHCADLSHWSGDTRDPHWKKVVESLTELVGAPSPVSAAPRRAWPALAPRRIWVSALAVALVAAGLALWLLRDRWLPSTQPVGQRVAILPFDTLSSGPDARVFADGLQDEILSVLSANQVATVSHDASSALKGADRAAAIRRLGAGLVLDGTVGEANGSIRVRVHLDDPAQHATVWSEEFERPASEAEPLQAEVAAKSARIAASALAARTTGLTDLAALADYVSADERLRFDWSNGSQAAEPILRRVVERAPRFAGGHTLLARSLASQAVAPGNPRATEQRAEAERQLRESLALDPKGANGAFTISETLRPLLDWQGREALLRKGMALDPVEAAYPYFEGDLLAHTGQLRAATETARRAVSFNPLWPGPTMDFGYYLFETGRRDEGQATFDRMFKLWPAHAATLAGRFWVTAMYGDPDAALALLVDPRTRPHDMGPGEVELWRSFLTAVKTGAAADRERTAARLRAAVDGAALPSGPLTVMLARLGDIDGAFHAADRYVSLKDGLDTTAPPYLFVTETAPLRRDPRFMGLAAKLGLVRYWRATGQWPDFCAEPGLPYDCKTEAARLSAKPT